MDPAPWLFLYSHLPHACLSWGVLLAPDGKVLRGEAAYIPKDTDGRRRPPELGEPLDHHVEYIPGTRIPQHLRARIRLPGRLTLSVESKTLLCLSLTGLGYLNPHWNKGSWHGELAVEGECWALPELANDDSRNDFVDLLCSVHADGQEGTALANSFTGSYLFFMEGP